MSNVLEVKDLTMDFGGLRAVDNATISVSKDEIVALIGPNGAGKTTFFNCITGLYKPTHGKIFISPPGRDSEEIEKLKPHIITEKGIARTFQNIRLFQNMTVLENVMVGKHHLLRAGVIGAIIRDRRTRDEEDRIVYESHMILEKIGLVKYTNEIAKNLPYGEQRKLEIARALATDPFIMLLDEPAAGMNPQETKELDNLILWLRDNEKITILLIEHDMALVMRISERIYVMDYGKIIAEGSPRQIKNNQLVIKAYLGEDFNVKD